MTIERERQRTHTRVYVPEVVGDLYNLLTAEGTRRDSVSATDVPFFKYKDVFLTAACLGFQLGRREALPKGDKKREIRLDTFHEGDLDILKAIAILEAGSVEILTDMGTILEIAETYAYAGVQELERQLVQNPGKPLWNFLSLIAPSV
ncbi:MAG: hypothetical protein DHS20C20_17070 [Ardenticatenaceae bacterium]|nr:MAG: hypothetical protein DHS20C20_17070 [Ardenticatenaceae bacterium]